jgi:hypothetical protein
MPPDLFGRPAHQTEGGPPVIHHFLQRKQRVGMGMLGLWTGITLVIG